MNLDTFFHVDWVTMVTHLYRLGIAYLLAVPIGWDRQVSRRHFGLRTFPLVAVVSCGFMQVGMSVISSTDGEARVIQGIITGIGFIGGGAIFKSEDSVSGTASAASIWNCGAIGLAVAFARFEIAITLSAINFIVLRFVGQIKENIEEKNDQP